MQGWRNRKGVTITKKALPVTERRKRNSLQPSIGGKEDGCDFFPFKNRRDSLNQQRMQLTRRRRRIIHLQGFLARELPIETTQFLQKN